MNLPFRSFPESQVPKQPVPKQPAINPVQGPKQNLGAVGDGKKNGSVADTETVLGQQQQKKLAILRQELCDLEKQKRAGEPCDEDIASKFRALSCHVHIDEWQNLLPVFDAIDRLGAEYSNAIVIFGGWHHSGELENINAPSGDLLMAMRYYRGLLKLEAACNAVKTGGNKQWSTTIPKLREHVKTYQNILPEQLRKQPPEMVGELLKFTEKKKPLVGSEIETALLFLHPRIFAFSPTSKNAADGWQCFRRFVFAYRNLVKTFRCEFGVCYWGIYPSA